MKTKIISVAIAAALVSGVYALADLVFAAHVAHRAVVREAPQKNAPSAEPELSLDQVEELAEKLSPVHPAEIVIPTIKLDSAIVGMGINQKGELDVPDGATSDVGWWKGGPVPGDMGSAVLDAHVYAAFSNLDDAKVGSDIYIVMTDGSRRHFVIEDSRVFKLEDLTSEMLFGSRGYRGLNLITCAGAFDSARDTYTHRLVVFARLVE